MRILQKENERDSELVGLEHLGDYMVTATKLNLQFLLVQRMHINLAGNTREWYTSLCLC